MQFFCRLVNLYLFFINWVIFFHDAVISLYAVCKVVEISPRVWTLKFCYGLGIHTLGVLKTNWFSSSCESSIVFNFPSTWVFVFIFLVLSSLFDLVSSLLSILVSSLRVSLASVLVSLSVCVWSPAQYLFTFFSVSSLHFCFLVRLFPALLWQAMFTCLSLSHLSVISTGLSLLLQSCLHVCSLCPVSVAVWWILSPVCLFTPPCVANLYIWSLGLCLCLFLVLIW